MRAGRNAASGPLRGPAATPSRTPARLRALRRPVLVASATVIALFAVAAALAPVLTPVGYQAQDLSHPLEPPLTAGHFLGTDQFGRDALARLLYGARVSLTVALVITSASLLGGTAAGLLAGYYGGPADVAITGVMDAVWSFPVVLIGVVLAGVIGPGLLSVVIAVSVVNWATCGRIVRGLTLSLRTREFVDAARACGCSTLRILTRHLLPNLVAYLLVLGSFYMGISITLEASLSFIGLGAQPPSPSWGQMLADGRQYMRLSHWIVTLPGLTVVLVVLAFNLLGDEVRDLVDPSLRGQTP